MKIGEHRAGGAKLKTGIDEQAGFSAHLPQTPFAHGAFDRAHAGGAHRHQAPRRRHARGILLRNSVTLAVQPVSLQWLGLREMQRLESAEADMQRHEGDFRAARAACVQHLGRKMQTGGGRGRRTLLAREHGLIPLPIGRLIPPLDVGRQRDMPDSFELFVNIFQVGVRLEAQRPFTEPAPRDHLRFQAFRKEHFLAHPHLLARMHQRFPIPGGAVDGPQQQDLDFAREVFAMAEQARWKYARIVQHQAVAGAEEAGQVAKLPVFPGLARAIDHQHARRGAVGEGLLRDELLGQHKIELGEIHLWGQTSL